MYERIYLSQPKVREIFENDPPSVFSWLIGRCIDGLSAEEMHEVWNISGNMINSM